MNKNKKSALLMSLVLSAFIVAGCFAGCKPKDNGNKIRVCETARSIFYAPLYVAVNNGYFADEGLDVDVTTVQGSDLVMTTVISGGAEIGLMGPETTVYCRVNGQKDYPVVFAQLTKRDGSFLVAKKPDEAFTWDKLKGKHVLAGRAGGVPAMTMQYIVNKAGMQTSDMKFNTDVSFGMMASVFDSDDTVDYTTMFEPTASEYVKKGRGYIVASVGEASGAVPYTAFSASKSYIGQNPERIKAFIRAIIKGYEFLQTSDSAATVKALKPHFAAIDDELIAASIESYRKIDAWAQSPVMLKQSFETLKAIMKNAGFLDKEVAFEDIVDNTYAEAVIAEKSKK